MIGAVGPAIRAVDAGAQQQVGEALPGQASCAQGVEAVLVGSQNTLEGDALAPQAEGSRDLLGPGSGIDIAHTQEPSTRALLDSQAGPNNCEQSRTVWKRSQKIENVLCTPVHQEVRDFGRRRFPHERGGSGYDWRS